MSYGFSSAAQSGAKDVIQLQQQNDGFRYINSAIHDSLGGNKPGTAASRMLLRRTLNDPQQRLARLGVHKPKYITDPYLDDRRQVNRSFDGYDNEYGRSPNPSEKMREMDQEKLEEAAAAMALELEGLKNAYRSGTLFCRLFSWCFLPIMCFHILISVDIDLMHGSLSLSLSLLHSLIKVSSWSAY